MAASVSEVFQEDWVMMALPIFLLALAIEGRWAFKSHPEIYQRNDFMTSMGVMVLTAFVDVLPKLAGIWLMFVVYELSPLKDFVSTSWPWWLLLFFLDDFTYYWFHRGNHEVRFMWAGHVSHHNSQYYNLGTALRQGVGERLIKYPFWLPLAFLGFHPVMIVTMMSVSLIYQYWLHTQAIYKLPRWIEFLFNTPSHHRVHHGSNVIYLDRNHAAILIIWDRMFGTFSEELESERVNYGITTNIKSGNVFRVAFDEYANMWHDIARARRWQDKLKYLLLAPGWSHDKPDQRSNALRAQLQ
ncbi:sterol desaturase family protein [Halieaceae bacterium IMCC14734]|uniref:Sterol desaturase family protein n=1 Tax=Candidatus Litorirhabdus singularis TaxID=2518993 RepID=A0ABT3TE37_9GAMM|nr:sterol desaturase family protein [Candidatus Litorirhabdus singularis]MCX2980576.1 sterol desaturase family protein [Candidatus Litorirhabdus singularis]